jgi:hypothetical protein
MTAATAFVAPPPRVTKGSFITLNATKGSFITRNATKGSFIARRPAGGAR